MNVLFLTIGRFHSINEHSIYPDLLREFKKNGHSVYIVCSSEKRLGENTSYIDDDGAHILRVKIGNITKTNLIEKGLSTIRIEGQYKSAIKRYLDDVNFDLVLYSTPPITLVGAIEYIKHKCNAKTYLLLKDIFPQNAVDIGMMSTSGIKGILYRHFRKQEKRLYAISDKIGCMSQANVDYVINHNSELNSQKVEVCPNSIEVIDKSVDVNARNLIRSKYGIPVDKKVFVYGGNLGKPQGIPFLIDCLKTCSEIDSVYFLIVGDGTEYRLLEEYANNTDQKNLKLMKKLPKEDYDTMVGACDVGMIFLDHRFTIPNFPSRLLSYMQARLPVLACTDPNTDIGKVIVDGGFGWWCESNNNESFYRLIKEISKEDLKNYNLNSYRFLNNEYSSDRSFSIIMKLMEV